MNKKTKLALEIIKDNICIHCGELTNEDLRKWFKDKWVNIGKKDKSGKHPPCGTSGKKRGYAKCVPAKKAASMSKKQKASDTGPWVPGTTRVSRSPQTSCHRH